ncbi:MAG TPA: c-type cytochrome biogenesis protein CcmI [Pyrinomonadaceae bacterium]|nr:c-type cytochrome biogenesis protein CcmI [Pyrinomonadaceae bacterium]
MLFWLICAVFIGIALAFILPTALQKNEKTRREIAGDRKQANIAVYRDQLSELETDLQNGIISRDQYTQDRDEIERRLLEDTATAAAAKQKTVAAAPANRNTAYALAVSLPLVAVIFYLQIGNPKAITDSESAGPAPVSATGQPTQAEIDARVAALAKRLQSNPSDTEGWIMLARSYASMERYGESAGAYAKATQLKPNDADLWTDYAFVSAMAAGQRLEGHPTELINQALKIDPENAKALQLAGTAAFQAKDYRKAIEYWERVLKKAPAGSELAKLIADRISEAKALAAGGSSTK